jgi:hypothetical protein
MAVELSAMPPTHQARAWLWLKRLGRYQSRRGTGRVVTAGLPGRRGCERSARPFKPEGGALIMYLMSG